MVVPLCPFLVLYVGRRNGKGRRRDIALERALAVVERKDFRSRGAQ